MASRKQPALQNLTSTIERRVFLGIGDAVLRLIHVERMYADGIDPTPELIAERTLIVQALNQQYQLDLGMDCDMDGIPDSIDQNVSMITHAAQTSCCRILPEGGSGSRKAPESRVEPLPDPTPAKKSPSRTATAKKKRAPRKEPPEDTRKASSQKPASRKAASRKASSRKAPDPVAKTDTKKGGGFLSSIFGTDEEKK
jgi:hypothetical protein